MNRTSWPTLLACLLVMLLTGCGGGGANSPGRSPTAASAAPVLQIVSPRSGEVVQAPVTVRYVVTGLDPGSGPLRLRLTIGDPPFYSLEWPVSGQEGTASIPDDKLVAGRRDLRFSLVGADRSAVAGSAPVTVGGVTIVGRR